MPIMSCIYIYFGRPDFPKTRHETDYLCFLGFNKTGLLHLNYVDIVFLYGFKVGCFQSLDRIFSSY